MNFKSRAWAGGLLTIAIAVVAVVVVNAQKSQRTDPLPAYFFSVEISGQNVGFFKSVGGLKIETDVIEYQEGGEAGGIIHAGRGMDVRQRLPREVGGPGPRRVEERDRD